MIMSVVDMHIRGIECCIKLAIRQVKWDIEDKRIGICIHQ